MTLKVSTATETTMIYVRPIDVALCGQRLHLFVAVTTHVIGLKFMFIFKQQSLQQPESVKAWWDIFL